VAETSGTTNNDGTICNGASATLTASGGTGYAWSTGATTAAITQNPSSTATYTVTVTNANGCTATANRTLTVNALPTASIAFTETSGTTNNDGTICNGASATLTASGGTGYAWSTGATTAAITPSPSSNTNYTVTVTNTNGCSANTSATLTVNPVPSLSNSNTNVSCNGGSNGAIDLTVTGGTGTINYTWSNSATSEDLSGLSAGTYSVTVADANACTATRSMTITQPSAIVITPNLTHVSCNGGSNGIASVSATGGTGTLLYLWSTGATSASISGLTAGNYSVTVTDNNGCSSLQSVTITQPQTLVASQGTVNNVSCFGGSNGTATVIVSGGTTPYSFDWTGTPIGEGTATASGLPIGNYTVNIVDNKGCTASQNFSIFQPAALSLNNTTQTNVSCNGGSNGTATIIASGGTAPYFYDWTGTPAGDGTATISGLSVGTYSVVVTDSRSCSASSSFTITQPAVLVTVPSNVLNVNCNGGSDGRINASTTGGTAPYSYNWTPGNPQGDGSSSIINLSAGTYTLNVQDARGCTASFTQEILEPTALVSGFASQTNILCNGAAAGAAAVVPASGGTAPYSYNWTPGNPLGDGTATVANLLAGNYNCRVSDSKGCFVDVPFNITQNNAITGSQAFDVCFGETVTVGTSVYSQSGTYTNVFTAANGCDSIVTTTLIVRPLISSSQSFTICNGQSVTVGNNTYTTSGIYTDVFTAIDGCDSVVTTTLLVNPTYTTNQNIQLCFGETLTVGNTTYTETGSYTAVLQSIHGCDSTVNTNLTVLAASFSTQNVSICFGETFTVGNSVYSQSGTYTDVFENQNGCDSTVTTNLVVRSENIVNQTVTLCAGETYSVGTNVYNQSGIYTNYFTTAEGCDSTHTLNLIVKAPVVVTTTLTDATIKANLAGASYQWINCSNNQAIAGATNQSYTATADGTYAVIITFNGCTDTSACVTVENVDLIENPTFSYNLYPNPASTELILETSTPMERVELLDLSGKVLQTEVPQNAMHHFNVDNLTRGMYLVRFTKNGEVFTKQFIKQ
ncbi:MAG: hypothetical protein RL264_971, partial [Bacteroidota bacterium]